MGFLTDDFLLETETARELYHTWAKDQPIYDYHCHLPVKEIALDRKFENLTRIWLAGDHYKWRAMRANGIDEDFITGNASDPDKFMAWAATVPKTLRNPLYHWTHLELKRPFGIKDILLNEKTAGQVWDQCNQMLGQPEFSACGILKQMNVKVVCTTDDPVDSLEHHQKIAGDKTCPAKVLPAFRPDKAMAIETPKAFLAYLETLSAVSDTDITSFQDLMDALKKRHDFFHDSGCRLSDHGLEQPYFEPFTLEQVNRIFAMALDGHLLDSKKIRQFKTAVLLELARMDARRNWTQQFHFGALRDTNTAALKALGPDTGYDSMGDFEMGRPLAGFFNTLAKENMLAKTILYNLNPRDNELLATMAGNFQDGSIPGKIQYGSAWWFLDQKQGMERQMDCLSNMGLISRFVGMLTDSRSFLSYPRHEYFRRILCNLFGNDIEKGLLPRDMELVGTTIADICFANAKDYFGIDLED